MKYQYQSNAGGKFKFGILGHKVLKGCKKAKAKNNQYQFTTTNSEIKKYGNVPLNAEQVGMLMFDLKKLGLIDYEYVETGRKARGSGRYELLNSFKFTGTINE